MNHADPWDEITRLESQMEVELLALRERLRSNRSEDLPVGELAPVDLAPYEPHP